MIAQGSAPSLKIAAQRPSSRQIQQAQAVPVQNVYKHRNKIECIATRYGKLASNFLSSVCLMAAVYFWLN